MKQFILGVLFFLAISTWFLCAFMSARADTPENSAISSTTATNVQSEFADALLPLSATWGGDQFIINDATTSLEFNQTKYIEWGVGYDRSNPNEVTYMNSLSNATYTIQLYEGVMGSSTLIYSETIPDGNPGSGARFPYAFMHEGPYILAYTATYPDGTYPIVTGDCPPDYCNTQKHSLAAFESFVTKGQSEDPSQYADFQPALLDLNQFTIKEAGAKASSVLFIPGTMESRLYTRDEYGREKMLWEPSINSDVPLLAINPDGSSKQFIYTRDIIDYLYSNNSILENIVQRISKDSSTLYGPFETFMDGLVSDGTIREWQAYPYDWRYDVSDIVKNGTLVATPTGDPHMVTLEEIVGSMASSSPTGQVTIIAHSNGGLLAKAFAVQLQKENKLYLLDRIIFVGTPQAGTPSAIGNIFHGDGQTRALGLITYAGTIRAAALTMPGPYDLLPTPFYFATIATPVISFGSNVLRYISAYGNAINTYDAFVSFLTDSAGLHAAPTTTDLDTPAVVSADLLAKAKETHDSIDRWVAPDSLAIDTIVGTFQLTPQGYGYSSGLFHLLLHTPIYTKFGDDTVVANSAANISQEIYYFAANLYKSDTGLNIGHQSLLSAVPIQNQIRDLLTGSTSTEQDIFAADSLLPSGSLQSSTIVRSSAPLSITVTDAENRTSGAVPITSLSGMYLAKEDIPNSSVQTYGNETSVSFPPAQSASTVSVQGYASGNGSIEVGTQNSDGEISITNAFPNVPATASTTGSFLITGSHVSDLSLDEDGDGVTDEMVSSTPVTDSDDTGISTTSTSDAGGDSESTNSTTTSPVASTTAPEVASLIPASEPSLSGMHSSGSAKQSVPAIMKASSNALYIIYLQLEVKLLELEIQLSTLLHHRLPIL